MDVVDDGGGDGGSVTKNCFCIVMIQTAPVTAWF